jgi:CheY-like chemotaxis protein
MSLHSLLVSNDPAAVRLLRRIFGDVGISTVHQDNVDLAFDALGSRKFDAVLVDCDDMIGARDVLLGLRKLPSNKRAIVFAIVNQQTSVQQAFELGANFVLDKPLAAERVTRSVRAAHGLMTNERRRYFRFPMTSTVTLSLGENGAESLGTMVNLSEGGMAVKMKQPLAIDTPLRFRFQLPDSKRPIEGKGSIAWVDSRGLAGVSFHHLSPALKGELQRFLASRFEKRDGDEAVFINATERTQLV